MPESQPCLPHLLAERQLVLRRLEVKVDKEAVQEVGDGVAVLVQLLADHLDQVLQHVAPPLVDYHGHRQVPQQVLAGQLDGRQVPG